MPPPIPKEFLVLLLTVSASAKYSSLFDCPRIDPPPMAENVSELHPAHVSIVMAAGDSITAAFAARGTLLEARDISWSIGVGSKDQITLPWLLAQYSQKVEGMSTKAKLPKGVTHLPHGDYHDGTDHLNVAESEGAVHDNSLVEQWGLLSSHLKKYDDLDSRWKVLTIWMTANDVCGKCDGPLSEQYLAEWGGGTEQFIANITSMTKRVYINLISTLDLSRVAYLQRQQAYCKFEHQHLLNECGCIDKGNATQLAQMDENVHTMNTELHKIAAKWQQKFADQGRSDVAIEVQPFQEGLGDTLDFEFLSDLDCFHPSHHAHQSLAIGLWNSMLCTDDRAHRCGSLFSKDMKPVCPDTNSRFYTGPDVVPVIPPAVSGTTYSGSPSAAVAPNTDDDGIFG